MEVILEKEDMICLVKGSVPYYSVMEEIKEYGQFVGGFAERWEWKGYALEKLDEEGLWGLYWKVKNSWKR